MKKIFSILICGIMSLGIISGCNSTGNPGTPSPSPSVAPSASAPASSPAKTKLIMATNAEFPPFEYIADGSGEIDGFDVALGKEIAKDLGLSFEVKNMAFDSIIMELNAGRADIGLAGMSKTPERELEIDFSDSYYTATQSLILSKDNTDIKSVEDLTGKNVGVQLGTTGDIICSDDLEGVNVKQYKKGADAVMELNNGKLDAVVIDANPAKEFVKGNDNLVISTEVVFEDEFYCAAIKKGNPELLESINKTIKRLKDSGEFDELVAKYIN